jgi:iron complex outermembrane receptor protein
VYSAGLTVQAGEFLRHFIRYEENYRLPKVDEHTNSPVVPDFFGESGDPLATQTGESTEVGMDWARNGHSASLVIYRLDLANEISFDPLQFRNVNIDSTRREGVILGVGWQIAADVSVGMNYSRLDTEIRAGDFAGNRVPLVAEHTADLNLDWSRGGRWHFHGGVLHVGNRVFSGDFAAELPELEGYTVAHAQLDFRARGWQLSLRANNLTDERYSGSGAAALDPSSFMAVESFYPAPARNGWLQLSCHIE